MDRRIAIYGPTSGQGSWPRVTRGICEGLRIEGALAGVSPTDVLSHTLDDVLPVHHDAPVAIHVGPPTMAMVMQCRGQHRHRLAMIAPNSSWLPATVFRELEHQGAVTGYVVPSAWAQTVMRSYTELPVYVYRHGVSSTFGVPERVEAHGLSVLHMASTHRQRKGTAELIVAWAALVRERVISPEDSHLRLVCDGPHGHHAEAIERACDGFLSLKRTFIVSPRLDLDDGQLNAFYQWHDLLCQPSRAEGFGLCPLEARACGVPVVMTGVTGHGEHAFYPCEGPRGGVIVVRTGPEAPIDDGPGATAPSLSVEDLRHALSHAVAAKETLRLGAQAWAARLRRRWSWAAVTGEFMRQYEVLFTG